MSNDGRMPQRFPDTMVFRKIQPFVPLREEPPAFLLKRKTMTPEERIARYRSLLERVRTLTYNAHSSYWVRHECRLRYLVTGGDGL